MGEYDIALRDHARRLIDLSTPLRTGLAAQVRALAIAACVVPAVAFFKAEAFISVSVEVGEISAEAAGWCLETELLRRLA